MFLKIGRDTLAVACAAFWVMWTTRGCEGFFDDFASSVTVNPSAAVIAVGDNINFTASVRMSSGLEKDVTNSAEWSASAHIAVVNGTGRVTASKVGQANISAAVGKTRGDSFVIITHSHLTSIEVAPAERTVGLNSEDIQFKATIVSADGSAQDLTQYVRWRSSDPGVGTISRSGAATPVGSGKATISASIATTNGVVTASANLIVE